MTIKEILLLIKFQKTLKHFDMKNWKTSLSGILALLPAVLHAVIPGIVSSDVAVQLSTLFASLGLFAAKDKNVTGGSVQQ